MRGVVRFDSAMRAILGDGFNTFLEMSAHPILQYYMVEGFKPAIERNQVPLLSYFFYMFTISTNQYPSSNQPKVTATLRRPPKEVIEQAQIAHVSRTAVLRSIATCSASNGEVALRQFFDSEVGKHQLTAARNRHLDALPMFVLCLFQKS